MLCKAILDLRILLYYHCAKAGRGVLGDAGVFSHCSDNFYLIMSRLRVLSIFLEISALRKEKSP